MRWQCGRHAFEWSDGPPASAARIMGVLNTTPDSFSDGGLFLDPDAAVEQGLRMVDAGAEIIDIGGESTRPGAEPVSVGQELERVLPVVQGLRARSPVCISIDTTKAVVAREALKAGADIVNDISSMTMDPAMVEVVAGAEAGVVLMHMRGRPRTMQHGDLSADDIVGDVVHHLEARVGALEAAGVQRERICVDPGIGFGKTVDQNLELIVGLDRLAALGLPILLGVSRKSFIGALTDRPADQRLFGTAAACAIGVWRGAHVLRVHDVSEIADVVRVTVALGRARSGRAR